jgi:hypothetical protein
MCGGTLRPSALTVFRLIKNSNFTAFGARQQTSQGVKNRGCEVEVRIDRISRRLALDLDQMEISDVQVILRRATQAGGFVTVDRDERVEVAVIV